MTVAPRSALAGAARVTAGTASSTGIGAVSIGSCPLVGSDCGPLRYGKKSTELEVVPPETVSTVAVPLTGFSGACGLVVGKIAGPGLVCEMKRRPHQLFSALSRLPWLYSEDDLMPALDAGAEDIVMDDDVFEILCEPSDLTAMRAALTEAGIEVSEAQIMQRPKTLVPLDEEGATKLMKLIDTLEDLDDTDEVHANFDIDAEILERVMG